MPMTMPNWRWWPLVREAYLNVLGRGARSRVLVLAAVGAGSVCSVVASSDWIGLSRSVAGLESDGWSTFVIAGDNEQAVKAESCAALASRPEVEDVYTVRRFSEARFVESGFRRFPIVELGLRASLLPVDDWAFESTRTGALIGPELIGALADVRQLSYQDLSQRAPLNVVGVLPDLRGYAGLDSSVVVPTPIDSVEGWVDECVVKADPRRLNDLSSSLAASVQGTGFNVTARTAVSADSVDPYENFLGRSSRFVGVLSGILVGGMMIITLRSRSSEFGVYLTSSTSKVSLLALLGIEAGIVHAAWSIGALTAALALGVRSNEPALASFDYQVIGQSVFALVAFVGSIGILLRRPSSLLKDR